MLNYLRMGLLLIVVIAGLLLPITGEAVMAWIAGGGFILVLVLSHPAVGKCAGSDRDQAGQATQR